MFPQQTKTTEVMFAILASATDSGHSRRLRASSRQVKRSESGPMAVTRQREDDGMVIALDPSADAADLTPQAQFDAERSRRTCCPDRYRSFSAVAATAA